MQRILSIEFAQIKTCLQTITVVSRINLLESYIWLRNISESDTGLKRKKEK